jgi:rod shape-determining protein MreC
MSNLRIALFVLLSVALMVADHRSHHTDALRDVLSTCLYPLQYLIQLPFEAGNWLSRNLASRSVLLEENARLHRKQLLINAQLQRLTALEAENRRLRSLLQSSVDIRQRTLIAELLNVDFDPYRHQVLLNKGTYHGVKSGQPLLNQRGVIGQIFHASLLTASAILITDPNHILSVQVNRNGMRTLALGTGRFQELELPYVPNNEDIQVGDLLVTSGLGGRFPPGYPVAKVSQVKLEPSRPFARIVAQPTAQLERSREFLLLINDFKTNVAQTDSALKSD